jgi:hypothetical protein
VAASDVKRAAAAHAGNPLMRKLGPLPAWAWAVAGGGALSLYRSRSASSGGAAAPQDVESSAPQGVNPDTGLPWNVDPNTGSPYGSPGGDGTAGTTDPADPAPRPGTQPETGVLPAPGKEKAKPPRKHKKVKHRRKRKPDHPAHGKHRKPPPHKKPKPKRRKLIPALRLFRDRKGVKHSGDTSAEAVAGKIRLGRKPKAAARQHTAGRAATHPADATRASSSSIPQGARPHAGGHNTARHDAADRGRARGGANVQGSVRRARALASPKHAAVPRQEPKPKAHHKPPPPRRRRRS